MVLCYYQFTTIGRHTQKAKPVQGVSLTIVHTKIKHTKKPNNLATKLQCTYVQLHLPQNKTQLLDKLIVT